MASIVYAKVMGSGRFPVDMLRYDTCSPATEQDSGIIEQTLNQQRSLKDNNWAVFVKKILIERRRKNEPVFTVGRWISFSCIIQEVDSPHGTRETPEERISSSMATLCTFNPE